MEDAQDAADALGRIAESGTPLISRGDESGTHTKELSLWENAGIDPAGEVREMQQRLGTLEAEIIEAMTRWEALEARAG